MLTKAGIHQAESKGAQRAAWMGWSLVVCRDLAIEAAGDHML